MILINGKWAPPFLAIKFKEKGGMDSSEKEHNFKNSELDLPWFYEKEWQKFMLTYIAMVSTVNYRGLN